MEPVRVLFVDDEPGICLLMSEILQRHGFSVRAVGTVADALAEITSAQFDVLISDLNIGHPGDGFTVVSAMRRTHPKCVTLILTGYPAFETALEAIRHQVDDYLIKPAHIPTLVSLIEQKLQNRKPGAVAATKRIAQILRDNSFEITQQALKEMKSDPLLGKLPITDEERIEHTPQVLEELATMLESAEPDRTPPSTMHASQLRGIRQHQLGYTIPLLATHVRLVERAIYDVIHENLKSLNLSYFMFDMKRLNDSLGLQLEHSLKAFLDAEYPAGLDARSRSGRTQQPLGEARVLKHPVAFAVFTGVVVEVTSLGAGLLLIRAHGNGWPWWFHGIVIASITGFMAALITYSVCNSWLRDRNRAKNQERIIGEVNHHINNALTIIRGRKLLAEAERDRLVEAEIERISWTIREILPRVREGVRQDMSEFPKYRKSSPVNPPSKG
jgi:DNA-binding response OmpR family regulator